MFVMADLVIKNRRFSCIIWSIFSRFISMNTKTVGNWTIQCKNYISTELYVMVINFFITSMFL